MKNLEQIRAMNALEYAGSDVNKGGTNKGEVVKKLPALIMSNGLLAAGAFAVAKGTGWAACFDYLAAHLAHPEIAVVNSDAKTLEKLLVCLTGNSADSQTLKLATEESLAWLAYAKRFVKKPPGEEDEE